MTPHLSNNGKVTKLKKFSYLTSLMKMLSMSFFISQLKQANLWIVCMRHMKNKFYKLKNITGYASCRSRTENVNILYRTQNLYTSLFLWKKIEEKTTKTKSEFKMNFNRTPSKIQNFIVNYLKSLDMAKNQLINLNCH